MASEERIALEIHAAVTLGAVRDSLAKLGLHVVGAADKAVLNECRQLEERYLRGWGAMDAVHPLSDLARAELARRKASEG